MEAKKILKDLVAINTIADKDNNRIMDYIDSFLSNLGFEIERKKRGSSMRTAASCIGNSDIPGRMCRSSGKRTFSCELPEGRKSGCHRPLER